MKNITPFWTVLFLDKKNRWIMGTSLVLILALIVVACYDGMVQLAPSRHRTLGSRVQATAPAPFMHRPFYGNQTISQRTTSFVDHDQPWYVNDGIFVRYDGSRWTNVAIGSCTGGVNCYDGHNGYDLNLWYEPVLSVAAGTVIRAGWYDPSNHASALGLWAAVDHGNGFVTAYGHLSALTVANGDKVGTQWQVGTSGTSGSSTGPHLHMATYYLPNWQATDPFGWTGNYADPNIVPDNYLWVSSPGTNYTVPNLSANGSAVYSGATLVDDGGTGWSSTGSWASANESTDIKGNLHYTSTTSGSASATATWQPTLSGDGYYEVGVFVDDTHASSSWSPYTVYSADPAQPGVQVQHTVYVDESHIGSFQGPYGWENTGPQWVSLGTYYFRASMSGHVVLSNATGETGLQISADGAEFVPLTIPTSYAEAFSPTGIPTKFMTGTTFTANVSVKNESALAWPASGSSAVTLGYHWLDSSGKPVSVSGSSGTLPADVATGQTVSIPITVHTPTMAGSYKLVFDLQQQNVSFASQGATPLTLSVTILAFRPR